MNGKNSLRLFFFALTIPPLPIVHKYWIECPKNQHLNKNMWKELRAHTQVSAKRRNPKPNKKVPRTLASNAEKHLKTLYTFFFSCGICHAELKYTLMQSARAAVKSAQSTATDSVPVHGLWKCVCLRIFAPASKRKRCSRVKLVRGHRVHTAHKREANKKNKTEKKSFWFFTWQKSKSWKKIFIFRFLQIKKFCFAVTWPILVDASIDRVSSRKIAMKAPTNVW